MSSSDLFKRKAMKWADQFEYCCVLDSNNYQDSRGKYDLLIAAGAEEIIQSPLSDSFHALKTFYLRNPTWMFGLLGYDLKNELEALSSLNQDPPGLPDLFFFVPKYLIAVRQNAVEVLLGDTSILQDINELAHPFDAVNMQPVKINSRMTRAGYLNDVNAIKRNILRGDVYEVTYCQEFYSDTAAIDPLHTFEQLNGISPSPFSSYLRIKDQYVLCASPERFLAKRGRVLISQPIKGTSRRSSSTVEDLKIKAALGQDLKEQTENVMIVDLVRNDLTKSASPGTVEVTELFGIYTFPQVHQMISTIECEIASDLHFIDAIKNTFPMGSMTGAPKIRAMELIDRYERSKRGAYSGALGYFDPTGDFDLNVVIRSIIYDAAKAYLSFQVGGAITYASDAEKEYEECLLKASAILRTIKGPR
jgi:para-aminobenzoate synthetase component 1